MSARPRVAFVVNGRPGSAMGERASAFRERLAASFAIKLIYRPGGTARSVVPILRELIDFEPECCYVFDLAAAGVLAAGLYRAASGTPFIVDTGDDIVALGRVLGRGRVAMLATRSLEAFALRSASRFVVRGSTHREFLLRQSIMADFIPDGVDVDSFEIGRDRSAQPTESAAGRTLTVGLIGSSVWIPSRQSCYGWELVELLGLLKDQLPGYRFRGVLIGDGSGIEFLRQRSRELGIEERMTFAGRIAYDALPGWLEQFHICLSTQTDDSIGWMRTTGKLPLYLAAGRFVIASRVGEASRVLPQEMLVDFHGSVDPQYPRRLAQRIITLTAQGTDFSYRPESVAIARKHFDYKLLGPRLEHSIRTVIETKR